jgi:hypothetical protein
LYVSIFAFFSPDEQRFLVVESAGGDASEPLYVIANSTSLLDSQ